MAGVASTIENERFMALHGARVFGRRNSPFAKARKSAPEAVESVIRKLKEEAARGHDNVAFIIASSFGLLKDFGLDFMRVVTRMAVESSTRGTASAISTGLDIASSASTYIGGVIGCAVVGTAGAGAGGAAGSLVPVAGTALGAYAGATAGCAAGTAQGAVIGTWVGRGLQIASYATEYVGESMAISGGKSVDLTFLCISLMVSGAIYLLMWNKGWMMKPKLKYAWWGAGFFLDNLPKVNVLPLTTISIAYTWMHVKRRSRAAEKKLADIEKLTQNEIEDLDQNISLLDKES